MLGWGRKAGNVEGAGGLQIGGKESQISRHDFQL